ncbi:endothelial cell-selective adhesion molecule [Amia ocellicauda]|uniref:endothelial cell-selective adhesion molecule n=1 Tax=Amia ocellicauda TaxID=2972642 RepID=UPI003463CC68
MEMGTSRKLGTLLSLTLLWAFLVESQVHMGQSNLEVVQGRTVVLQAWYTSPSTNLKQNTILWNYVGNSTKTVISFSNGQLSPGSKEFVDRVGFSQTIPSTNVSIYINKTVESDSGHYVCNVIIPGSPTLLGEIVLDVKVPPSVPKCKLTGVPVVKGNVTLTCSSQSGKPVPIYKWTRTGPVPEVFFPPRQNEKTGTLQLNNLSKNMSGKYECKASNSAGAETCFIQLEVSSPTKAGVIAGATVGSIIGFVALILFLVFILRRRRDSEDEMANDIKEDAQAPKRVSWAKSGTGSDIVSKNGTLSSITTNLPPRDPHLNHYPNKAASDTASIGTAAGSTLGYRPGQLLPRMNEPPSLQGLPGYNSSQTLPRVPPVPASTNGGSVHRTEGAQPQAPRPPLILTGMTTSNLLRMGGVPIMVPAQNQAGSLV